MLSALDISASGLYAQRTRMNTIAGNIANIDTLEDEKGKYSPYQRKVVIFAPGANADGGPGVRVSRIENDKSPFKELHIPGHEYADEKGNVKFPNIDYITEMVNMIESTRAYEANVTAMDAAKSIFGQDLQIIA